MANTLLVVDDSETHRTVISSELRKLGYEVLTASGGSEALKLLSSNEVDLMLLDIDMPGLDGFATLRQVRQLRTRDSLPVIMLTARDSATDVIQAQRLGADDYAVKPITRGVLKARIETHLLTVTRGKDEVIGKYRIIDKIGEGAMGTVFRAEDIKTGRMAALKILPCSMTVQPAAVHRFLQEASLVAKVRHPNVVQLYDFGQDGKVHYLSMEYVRGQSLDSIANKGHLEPALAMEICREVLVGLEHLESQGIIHRDIKPHNIMLADDGAVKIADFGIARDVTADHRLTREGTGLGSLIYSSPEQIAGKGDFRGDMYSLGATLFHLVTGEPPFPRDKPLNWMIEHKWASPPNAAERRAELPNVLCSFISRLMSPTEDKRFNSYTDLTHAYDHTLNRLNSPGKELITQYVRNHPPA